MTAPRIISAYEAEALLRHGTDAELAAGAPDLAASVVALHARAEQAEANYRWMVERAADQRLDGYRELGARAASAENESDRLRVRLRDVAQILIAHTGADGPMDAEDAARKVVERIETLQRIADEKSHETGLYARRMSQAQIAMRAALAKAQAEPDHDYRETTYDRDDRPIPPTCAHCGRAKAYCKGRKP